MSNKVIETLCEVREMTVDEVAEIVGVCGYEADCGNGEINTVAAAKALAKLGTIRVVEG